jgi:hypothetical protein
VEAVHVLLQSFFMFIHVSLKVFFYHTLRHGDGVAPTYTIWVGILCALCYFLFLYADRLLILRRVSGRNSLHGPRQSARR